MKGVAYFLDSVQYTSPPNDWIHSPPPFVRINTFTFLMLKIAKYKYKGSMSVDRQRRLDMVSRRRQKSLVYWAAFQNALGLHQISQPLHSLCLSCWPEARRFQPPLRGTKAL